MRGLTGTQKAVLHFIQVYVKEVGYPPTIREIAKGVKLRSTSSVVHHLRTLHTLGYLRRAENIPRGLVINGDRDG